MQNITGNTIIMYSQRIVSVCLCNTKNIQNIEAGSTVGQKQIMKPNVPKCTYLLLYNIYIYVVAKC